MRVRAEERFGESSEGVWALVDAMFRVARRAQSVAKYRSEFAAKDREVSGVAKCQLCGVEKELMGAHIIPHGSFRRVRGGGGPLEFIKEEGHQGCKSRGFVDGDILCSGCDGSFSTSEEYFMIYLENNQNKPNNNGEIFVDANINYDKFKIAILFTVWKMAISKTAEFNQISLGAAEEKRLFDMVRDKTAGSQEDFPIFLRRLKLNGNSDAAQKIVLSPKQDGADLTFLIQGWEIMMCTAEDCREWPLLNASIKPGELVAGELELVGSPYWPELQQLGESAKTGAKITT